MPGLATGARSWSVTEPMVTLEESKSLGLGAGVNGADVVLNPLPPCGSCTEWLRKIAEVNPDFKVLTFTDTSCSYVFVRSVE